MYNIVKMSRTVGKYKKKRRSTQKKKNGRMRKVGDEGTKNYFTPQKESKTSNKEINSGMGITRPMLGTLIEEVELENIDIKSMSKIGNESLNGYVLKIEQHDNKSDDTINRLSGTDPAKGPTIFTVMKIPQYDTEVIVDNLDYEHKVGLYINDLMRYYPCFVKTMDFVDLGETGRTHINSVLKNQKFMNKTSLKARLKNIKKNIQVNKSALDVSIEGCANKNNHGLQLQYVDGKTLANMMDTLDEKDIYGILLQVYGPLYNLSKDKQTGRQKLLEHKDLHQNNILVVTLPVPIKMVYNFDFEIDGKKEITICTKYIAKIIDYGRCYIPSTEYFYDEMRQINEETDRPTKKQMQNDFLEYLSNCGLKHILFNYPDYNMYKRLTRFDYKSNKAVLEDIIGNLNCKKSVFNFAGNCSNNCKQTAFTITIDCSTQDIKKQQQMITDGNLNPFVDETILIDYGDVDPKQNLEKTFEVAATPRKP
jgi:hypothetical protein